MRISDCAELTGTTVRTIRYYHQMGLLPVPERWAGRRDYDLEHVARLLRIRWLADAGIPLEQIRGMLHGSGTGHGSPGADEDHEIGEVDVVAELRATAAQLDAKIAELSAQRERIDALIDAAATGRGLRALPPGLDRFYARLAADVTDPVALDVLRREERLAEMYAQRGLVSPEFDALITELTEEDLAAIVDFYGRFGRLDGDPDRRDALIADMYRWSADRADLVRDLVAALPAWSRSVTALRPVVRLTHLFAHNADQAAFVDALMPIVTDVLEEKR